jgi:nucleoside-diphosphate-sugar epimerase
LHSQDNLINPYKGEMMDSQLTVMIVGITGVLGGKIAAEILDKGKMHVKGLVRSLSQDKQQKLQNLTQRGVELIEGDLFDMASLDRACKGVDIVVSATKGHVNEKTHLYREDIILSGQLNLLEAAMINGVTRFVPSDYSVNHFNLDLGDNYNLDLRKIFAEILKQSGMNYTFILNGAFTEVQLSKFGGLFDFEAQTFSYWGDGEQPCDFTTYDDTAKYVAEAIADPEMNNRMMKVAGDVLTMKQLLNVYEEIAGKKLKEQQLGTITELKAWINKTKLTARSPFDYLMQQYHYTMVSGKGKLDRLDNDRYPHIHPTTVKQFINQAGL